MFLVFLFYLLLFVSIFFISLLLNRTNFDYLQEVPILTLNVSEDFKGKHDSLVEKVKDFLSTL